MRRSGLVGIAGDYMGNPKSETRMTNQIRIDETRNGIRFVILVWGSIGHSGFGFRIFCVLTISRAGSIIDCDG